MPADELVFPGMDGGLLAGDNMVAGDDVTGFILASQELAQ